jgi:hypothetical protein
MKTKIIIAYASLSLVASFIPNVGDNDIIYNVIESSCDVMPWALAFMLCGQSNKYLRSALFAIMFGCAINVPLVCFPSGESTAASIVFCVELVSFFAYPYFVMTRKINIESDAYSAEKVYILAKLPTGMVGYLSCLFSPPIGGIAIVACGMVGAYRKEEKRYIVSRYFSAPDDCLIEIDCRPELAGAYMDALTGRRYSLWRDNCVNAAAFLLPGYDTFFRTPYNLARHAARIRDERRTYEKRFTCRGE